MIYTDGSIGAGFKVSGKDIACVTTDEKNEFTQQVENLINSAQENLRIQIFYKLSPDFSEEIEAHENISKDTGGNYGTILKHRVDFLHKNQEANQFFKPEIHIFVRSEPQKFRKQKLFESQSKYHQISKDEYTAHEKRFLRSIRQIESSLEELKLGPKRVSKEKWFDLLFGYLNFKRSESIGFPTLKNESGIFGQPLNEQLQLGDLKIHPDYLESEGLLFKVITLKTLPEQSFATMIDGFTKLPFHFWLTQNIAIHDQKKEVEKLNLQRRLANSMASGAKNMSDLESESKLAHIEELIAELLEGSEKIISCDFNMVIWAESKEELEDKSDHVLKAFKNMNQSEGIVETLPCFDAFLSAMPSSCQGFRYKKMKTSNVAHLSPLYGSWAGNRNPVCIFPNRDGALTAIDPFDPVELMNWNGVVLGSSGSGKSFVMSQLMMMFSGYSVSSPSGKLHPKIVWLDNGASSQNLVEVMNGEIIDLTMDSGICLNVFDLPKGEKLPEPGKIKLILGVLETIFKEDDKIGLPKRDKSLIEEAIFTVYQENEGVPTLSDFKKVLEKHEDPTMRQYAQSLFSWTGKTPYGKMLDGQSNVSLDKNLITIEMKGLDAYADLQNVFLLLFTDFIKAEASRDLSRPYILICDEAWKLFSTASGASFVFEAYRTFRKFLGGLICVSQSYEDMFANAELRRSILPNTSFLYILKQQVDDWDDFSKKLGLNEAETSVVKSIQTKKGEYSEVFLKQNENRVLLRIVPDPLSYWVCTSDANDKVKIAAMEAKYPEENKLQALVRLSNGES